MFQSAGQAARTVGVTTEFLRRMANQGELPEDAVLATPGKRFRYDAEKIKEWMKDNYKRLTKVSRMEAK